MRDSLMWFLLAAVVVSALFVVNARHQHRVAYLAFQDEEARRDDLSDEWGRLLIAQQLWSSPNVIEADAREKLSMRAPKKGEMEVIDFNSPNRNSSSSADLASDVVDDAGGQYAAN